MIEQALSKDAPLPGKLPWLGIDECLNRTEIEELVVGLIRQRLIKDAQPLWSELRVRRDGSLLACVGGISRNSILRKKGNEVPFGDIGKPVKHHSFADSRIVQLIVASLTIHDTVVVLSENTRNNKGGLRNQLNELVKPILNEHHGDRLSLVVLFKKGRSLIRDYCSCVMHVLETHEFGFGYNEQWL